MSPVPIPRDIPLPLPASPAFLESLLVLAFIAHILFVNLMVGGSLLVLGLELRGLRDRDFDRLARLLSTTVTVNKSLAVVLGVAPLLLINLLYTVHFYTANALTGTAWILLIPTIASAFLLLYLHKYTWERLESQKGLHISILALAVVLFLCIPLVFLANVNLMMFPDRWTGVRGFLSSLALPNVFPRYLHFLCASLIVTSLFGVGYFGRAGFPTESHFATLSRPALRRIFYTVAFAVSLAQFLVGPLVLFTLPAKGMHPYVILLVLAGAALALPAVWMMWKEVTSPRESSPQLPLIVGLLSLTVLFMAAGRNLYRAAALSEHQAEMKRATEKWEYDSAQAAQDVQEGRQRAAAGVTEGQHLFQRKCAACHGVDTRIVGPPLTEIAKIYRKNPAGIVTWARAPGKKRADVSQMPAFAWLGDEKLRKIAEHMLKAGDRSAPPNGSETP
jgi:cytochrome c